MSTEHRCAVCGSPVVPPRLFCRLSCRIAHDRQQVRTPKLFPRDLELTTELPTEDEVRAAREQRERIRKLYGRTRP